MKILKDAETEILTFYDFFTNEKLSVEARAEARKHIYTSNPIERLNREVKRRSDIAMIFPNRDSAIRLCGAIFMDISFEGQVSDKPFIKMFGFLE